MGRPLEIARIFRMPSTPKEAVPPELSCIGQFVVISTTGGACRPHPPPDGCRYMDAITRRRHNRIGGARSPSTLFRRCRRRPRLRRVIHVALMCLLGTWCYSNRPASICTGLVQTACLPDLTFREEKPPR